MDSKIVYQIYPKSFNDANGDGVGDIRGIIERLDYLSFMGVDVLWLTPVFISPQNDNGYDVEDYYHVDPLFGTDEDLQELIDKAKDLNIDIMLDMVFNHASTQHTWFQKALNGESDYQSRFYFVDKPVNWQSKFGGSAFEYVEDLGMYYLHLFDKTQADFNWEHPKVFNEFVNICNYWLKKGVRGFRFDVINLISKPEKFKDGQGDGRYEYTDGPKVTSYLRELGSLSFSKYEDVMTVGELSSTSIENASQYSKKDENGLSTVFNFHHLKVDYKDGHKWELQPFDFIALKKLYCDWQEGMLEANASMSLFLNNHDQPRAISRFTDGSYEGGSMLAQVLMTLRGVVYLYQGEEIGLPNAYFNEIESYRDIESLNHYNLLLEKHNHETVMNILRERSRDNSRTPIPWDDTIHHGFSNKEPWIPFSKGESLRSVDSMMQDTHSLLHTYRNLIRLRKSDAVLIQGMIEFVDLDHPQLFVYKRILGDVTYLCIHNFYTGNVLYPMEHAIQAMIAHNYPDILMDKGVLQLRSYESLIISIL